MLPCSNALRVIAVFIMLLACSVLYGMGAGNEKPVKHEDIHQGSLRALVKRDANQTVAIAAYKDYYPYGQLMPGRNYQTTDYRYGYQGQYAETDPETGFTHFEAREFESRLGRWMIPDPARQHWCPYLGMGNNPVSGVDPDGRWNGWWKIKGSEGTQTTEWYPVDEIAAANPNLEYVGDENYTFGTVGIDGPTISAGMSQSQASAASLGIYSAHHNFWENPFVKGTTFVLTGLVGGEIVSGLNYAYKAFSTYWYAGMGAEAAKTSTTVVEEVAVHGNSLKSLKPTWGYKLYSNDGTFLKNGITSKLVPETRYTKAFMSDKFMVPVKQFPNRLEAWQWEFQQNQILRGPLNLNMH